MSSASATGHDFAAKLRGFGPVGIAAILLILGSNLVIAPVGAVFVLVWARISHVSWTDLGFSRPRSWLPTVLFGILAGVILKLLMKAVVMPLLGGPAINGAYHFVAGNRPALVQMIVTSIITGGIGEEIVYRGFLFERLWRLWGKSTTATAAIVLVVTAFFASIHIPEQGPYGAVQALFTGLTFGTVYAVTRRLWLPMVIHAAFDVTAVLLIYFNLEARLAGSLFG
jgi:uncharacterized protein